MAERPPIYLDYHATTPVDPRVLEAMLPYFTEHFGNASSRSHAYGWGAEAAVSDARLELVSLVGARSPDEIVFTSGATESNNLAISGVMHARGGGHVITSSIEHPSVEETCRHLESLGMSWTAVDVDSDGLVSPEAIEEAIRPDTALISVMAVNNEVGTIQPIAEIAEIAARHGALLHCDAAQAAGRIPLDVYRDGVDLLSLSAHKIYGPKGIGALYVRRSPRRTPILRQLHGGGQERGLRSGTHNVPGIVGFGTAARIAREEREPEMERQRGLRDQLLKFLQREVPELRVYGSLDRRVATNLNVSFGNVRGDALTNAVPDLALSGGAACSSGKAQASRVLTAMGVDEREAQGALRIAIGRMTTAEDVIYAGRRLASAARKLARGFSARGACRGSGA
jgi:cysteine desulfurase